VHGFTPHNKVIPLEVVPYLYALACGNYALLYKTETKIVAL